MDTETYIPQKKTCYYKTKVPVDVRIVAYFLYAVSFFQLAIGCFLITGMGRLEPNFTRRVLFGTVLLSTELYHSIYTLCMGSVRLLCAWGLIRGRKFVWCLTLIFFVYELIDMLFLFPQDELNGSIGIIISITIIIWLCFRRKLYKVGLKQGPT